MSRIWTENISVAAYFEGTGFRDIRLAWVGMYVNTKKSSKMLAFIVILSISLNYNHRSSNIELRLESVITFPM